MSRYYKAEDIEREIVRLLQFKNESDYDFGITHGIETVDRVLKDLPTIDIVHCQECKYREKCEQIVVFDIGENQIEGRKIGFCSYGERIDNE